MFLSPVERATAMVERVRVVVADDHPIVREGLVRLLQRSGTVDVVAEVGDGRSALQAIQALVPGVALLDQGMPALTGAEVVSRLRELRLPTRVLMLSAHVEPAAVEHSLRCGAVAHLPKESRREDIVRAVHDAAAGRPVVSPNVERPGTSDDSAAGAAMLSPRELEVLRYLSRGFSVPTIAAELFLAPSTVKTHVQRLYAKLEVNDRGAAIASAMRRGLIR